MKHAKIKKTLFQLKKHLFCAPAGMVLLIGAILLGLSLGWFLFGILCVVPAEPSSLYRIYIPAMEYIIALYCVTVVGVLCVDLAAHRP